MPRWNTVHILMEQSGHALLNVGDWAMLQVATRRCEALFPGCHIKVIAEQPSRLKHCLPYADAITLKARRMALGPGSLFGRFSGYFHELDASIVSSFPRMCVPIVLSRYRTFGSNAKTVEEFYSTVRSADLVIASGGGYITDRFPEMVKGVCSVLYLAQKYNVPTAMIGQGLGPLTRPALQKIARRAMRGLNLLTLREKVQGLSIARRLGVRTDRIRVTGDDAIELAYDQRTQLKGNFLGLNVRTAHYANMPASALRQLAQVVQNLLRTLRTQPQLIPISLHEDEDATSTSKLILGGQTGIPVGATPEEVIRAAGRCRLIITGSYHAGVFALSQGVPVIGLARSQYYLDKFSGLSDQFGSGCEYVYMDSHNAPREIEDKALRLWENADHYCPELLRRAEDQIAWGRAAFQLLGQML